MTILRTILAILTILRLVTFETVITVITVRTVLTIENLNSWQSLVPNNQLWHRTAFALLEMFFSCPSSTIPTLLIDLFIHWFTIPNSNQTIPTLVVFEHIRHHNFNKISQFLLDFTIFSRFHNFDQIYQIWQKFTIFSCPSTFLPTVLTGSLLWS